MAYQLLINSIDRTSWLQRPSAVIETRSDNKADAYFSLITTAANLGTDDGLIVGLDVKIKEDTTVLFGGVIKKINIIRYSPDLGNTTTIRVDVTCNDYNEIAARRVISGSFTSVDASDVVQEVLDNFNLTGFDDNVGTGTISTGASINTYSYNAKTAKDVLDEMAEASGYKWYIDFNKDLYFIEDDTITNSAHDLVETAATFTDFYVRNVKVDNTDYVNKQWVLGTTDDTGAKVNVNAEDSTEIASRASIEGTSGVYGAIINATESQDSTDAQAIADNALKVYGKVPYYITFTSYTNDWIAGTKLKCNLPTMGISSDTYFLIESVEMEDMGTVFMSTVTATRRNDADFSTQRTANYVDYFSKLAKTVQLTTGDGGTTGTSNLIVSATEPTGASANTLWEDPDDYSNATNQQHTASATISLDDGYVISAVGAITLTLPTIATLFTGTSANIVDPSIIIDIWNESLDGASTVTVVSGGETFNGLASPYLIASPALNQVGHARLKAYRGSTDWKVI